MLADILALSSILAVILLLNRLVNIFPSLVACTMRWKENINLEASVKHSLDRDMLAAAMVIPFCLVADDFGLYAPKFMEGLGENTHLALTIGIFAAYCIIRVLLSKMLRPHKMSPKTYKTAGRASFTFFIILTLLLLALGGIMRFIDIDPVITRNAMLCVSAFIYALFLLRKLQIFNLGGSFFAGFLYLCALEILPTGILIIPALIF